MSTKIKLIEVISDSGLGGGPSHVFSLLKNIDKEKFDLLLIAPRGWLTTEAKKIKDIDVKTIEFKSKYDIKSLGKLRQEIGRFRLRENPFGPAIIHAHGPRAGWFAALAKKPGEKLIYTEHLWNENYNLKNPFASFFQLNGLKIICKKADKIFAVSESVKKFLEKNISGSKEKIVVIPNAIELPKLEIDLKKPRHQNGEFIIGTVGNLNYQKGQIYLIRAFAEVLKVWPNAKLEIIGDGPEEKNLRAEMQELEIEAKVQLLGHQKNIKKYLQHWDLFVLPSLSETFGLVVLESFAAGVPVIATKVGGIPEIIKNGENGVLVPPTDGEKLARAILNLLSDRITREKFARHALSTLKERFDWSKIIVEMEEEYKKIIQ